MLLLPIKSAFVTKRVPFLFVSVAVSFSVPVESLSQHCLQEGLLLSANLACSPTGTGDLVFPIGQQVQPIYVDSYIGNSASPSFSPWSYRPVCTEILEGIGSELCVYTNSAFSGGRGISIFTTPKIAEEFAAMPPLQESAALDAINISGGPWHTQKLPHKGTGMLAKCNLQRGDLIMAFTPVLLAYTERALSTPKREKFLRIAVDQLPFATRESYLSLATIYGDPAVAVQDIIKANTFEMQVGGQMHLAVFPEPSRMNHDCAPNSQYYLDPSLLTHYVHATRPISQNQEITISYLNPFQPYESRQKHLLDAFHFTCSCTRCVSGNKSDAVIVQITSLQQTLGDWSPESTATTEKAEKLIQLHKEEGLDSFLDSAYGYAALTYNAIGDVRGAKEYANLAAEAVALKDGQGAADFRMWKKMIENPKNHWSWRWRSD